MKRKSDDVALSIGDRLLAVRDRIYASRRFQNWASVFPLTRPIARARAMGLFDLCAGFVYSQILAAICRLGILELLQGGPRSLADVALATKLSEERALRLLRAGEALRLTAPRSNGRWGLGDLGAALLGNSSVLGMIDHHRALYEDLADPVGLLRTEKPVTKLGAYWGYAGAGDPARLDAGDVGAYSRLMAQTQAFIADDVLKSFDVGRFTRLLDVGGGEGAFAVAALRATTDLHAIVLDLPAVAAAASARFEREGLALRAQTAGGDFFNDPWPEGADLISFVRVLHDHDDAPVAALLRRARAALAPGGAVLIAEPMSQTRGAERMGAAYFGFYLLAMGSGRPRTTDELAEMAREAGFSQVQHTSTPRPFLTSAMLLRA